MHSFLDRATISQEMNVCLGAGTSDSSSHLQLIENGLQKNKRSEIPETTDSSSSCSTSSNGGGSSSSSAGSSSSNALRRVTRASKRLRETSPPGKSSGVDCSSKSGLMCRSNTSQNLEYGTSYINDASYRLQTKMSAESHDSPWRYVPVVKRLRVALQPTVVQKDEGSVSTQVGNSLQLMDRSGASEIEDGTQDRHSFLSVTEGRKQNTSLHMQPNTIHTYRKLECESDEKHQIEKVERMEMQRKMARIEKELRLQKSLSEECEDLGVDEPSTSELFPEADLLLDPNSSPSFEQAMQEASCSQPIVLCENYSVSNYRHEYSSSSQEGSQHGNSTVDSQVGEDSENRKETRSFGSKKSYSEWNFRMTKERIKYNNPVSLLRGKLNTKGETMKSDPSDPGFSISKHGSKNLPPQNSTEEELKNVSSVSVTEGIETSQVLDSCKQSLEKSANNDVSLNGDSKSEKSILAKTLYGPSRPMNPSINAIIEVSQDNSSKQVLTTNVSIPNESRVPKSDLPVTSSSEDSVTLDSFTTSMVASSLDVTIPSPVPNILTSTAPSHLMESSSTRDTLPTLTAAQKFAYTYGKRQDVCRVIKRARLNRPNQYFNEHVDSQETWDSSSSQDKTCGDDDFEDEDDDDDDDDSEETSPSSHISSQLDDGANTDVDVMEISNDESSALPSVHSSFPLLPSINKLSSSNSKTKEVPLKLSSTNGMDSFEDKSALNSGKKIPVKKSRANKRLRSHETEKEFMEVKIKMCRVDEYNQTLLSQQKRLTSTAPTSTFNVPTKDVSGGSETSLKKQPVLRTRRSEDLNTESFPVMLTDTAPSPEVSETSLIEKRCPVGGTCETHLKPTRSSQRKGNNKKSCTCCNGATDLRKKKKNIKFR